MGVSGGCVRWVCQVGVSGGCVRWGVTPGGKRSLVSLE